MQDFIRDRRYNRFVTSELDKTWMRAALNEAALAADMDEVPIGACIVAESGELLAAASNRTITDCDPTAHAEILVIRMAAELIGNYRLVGTTVYATIEPCVMCAGALINARVERLVYGSADERFGAVDTHFGIGLTDVLNHKIIIDRGVLADECRGLMQQFFKAKRDNSRSA
jgi:tRNA(adenine34) deaminase